MVAGGVGEQVDLLLVDQVPVAVAEVLADQRPQPVDAVDVRRHELDDRRAWENPVLPQAVRVPLRAVPPVLAGLKRRVLVANCSQCGSDVTEGATFCPVCGTPTTVGDQAAPASDPMAAGGGGTLPPQAPAPAPRAGGGTMPAYKFDIANLQTLERVGAGATFVLFIALFLDWYHVSYLGFSASASALSAHGYMYITLILCLVILAIYVAKLGFGKVPFNLPITEAQLILGLSALNLLLVIIAFADKESTSWSFGAYLGLLAALAALAPTAVPFVQKQMAARK
jgi:zinc-ribbon domain